MEKQLVKGAIYSFLIALLAGLLIFPYETTRVTGYGVTTITEVPLKIFLFKLLRFASFVTLCTIAVLWVKRYFIITDRPTTAWQFIKGMILSFVICSFAITAILWILALFTN